VEIQLRQSRIFISQATEYQGLTLQFRDSGSMSLLREAERSDDGNSSGKCDERKAAFWRRGAESNRRIEVLQTSALPLGYRAPGTSLAGQTQSPRTGRGREFWSGRRGSNPRLRPWQGRTLPLSYSRASLIITKRNIKRQTRAQPMRQSVRLWNCPSFMMTRRFVASASTATSESGSPSTTSRSASAPS
jgi:hypothetical protein